MNCESISTVKDISMIPTRKIGERFKIGGVGYIVARPTTEEPCKECAFYMGKYCNGRIEIMGFCYKDMRRDKTQVIFKKTNE